MYYTNKFYVVGDIRVPRVYVSIASRGALEHVGPLNHVGLLLDRVLLLDPALLLGSANWLLLTY